MSEGAFSNVVINGKTNRLIKTYVEHRGETDSPYLSLIGNNVYVVNWFSENDSHKRMMNALPAEEVPKIYSYSEKKYLDEEESKRPPIPEPLKHRNIANLMICRAEMDYLPYQSLNKQVNEVIQIENISEVKNILKQWFEKQLMIIKVGHMLPWDISLENMLYDRQSKKIYFIDYAFYEVFSLVERINPATTKRKTSIYWFDPVEDKHGIFKHEITKDEIKMNVNDDFVLTDDEVRDLFIFRLMWFHPHRQETKLHFIIMKLYGLDKCIELHVSVMNELGFNQKQIKLLVDVLRQGQDFFKIKQSVRNWLGGPYGKICSTHKLFTYMKIFPDAFKRCYDEIKPNIEVYQKMSHDEFWDHYVKVLRQTKSSLYCQLAYTIHLKYDPNEEFERVLDHVNNGLENVDVIYRCETTDRFNGENKLTVGKTIKWENLIPGTEDQKYALSYLSNGRGTSIMTQNEPQHYLFVFRNIRACHLHDYYSNLTTYTRRYNASNVKDANRLNCFFPCVLIVSNEWIIDPFKTFKVVKTGMIKSQELTSPGIVTNKPIKETFTGNELNVNVIYLEEI